MNRDPLDNDWDYKDCRLENNGIIPKTCGYNKTFRYKVPLQAHGVMGNLIDWCIQNCNHKWSACDLACPGERHWNATYASCQLYTREARYND